MALGSGFFEDQYKNMSLEELEKELEEEKKLYNSGYILKAEEERIQKGIDDNSPLSDYETKISVLEKLINEKKATMFIRKYKTDGTEEELNINLTDIGLTTPDNLGDNTVFTSYVGFDLDEMRKLISDKINLLQEKLNGNINEQEKGNAGYLLWNCKMILRNISMTCDKITNKFKEQISQDEFDDLTNKANIIKTDEPNWIDIDAIKATYKKIIDSCVVEKFKKNEDPSNFQNPFNKNDSKISELKENEMPSNYEHNYITKLEEILKMDKSDILKNFKRLEKENATYYYNPIRGGTSVIVSDDGSYLGASSSVNFDRHLEEFKNGKRNGKFKQSNTSEKIETENIHTRNFKEEFENCIISHNELITKPPVYDMGYPLLLDHQNNNYVAWLLNNHTNFYVNDDSINNDFIPTAILIYNLSDKKSKIFKIDEFAKEFKIDILNAKTKELMFDTIDIKNIINLKQNLNNDFISLLNDGVNIDFNKYNNYFSTLLSVVPTNQKKYYGLFDIKINNDKVLKLKCHSCGNELKIDCSNYPKNIKTLDSMCDVCKSMIKFGNLNYKEDNTLNKSDNQLEIHIIEKIGIPTKQFENTLLYIKDDNVKVDNNSIKTNKNYDRNLLFSKIKSVLPKLRDISNQQTPEFLSQHISYSDSSKIFNLVFNKEKISLKCNTGTDTDEFLNRLIEELIEFVVLENDNLSSDQTQKITDEDIENMKKTIKQAESLIFGENKDLNEAKKILLDFAAEEYSFENSEQNEYYNFHDVIEFVLYIKLNKPKKEKILWSAIPFGTVFSYLSYIYNEEKDYNNALKMIDKAIKWMPMSTSPLFEKCETYKMQNMWEKFKEETLKFYSKIYDANDLARFYRNLGFYYIEKNQLNLAYALYTASIQFEKHKSAFLEMAYINQKLNREKYLMSEEETLKLLNDNNIPFGAKKENIDLLISIYENEEELIKNPNTEMLLASKIYYLSNDNKFAPFYEIIDNTTRCSIVIPRSWKIIKQEVIEKEFSKNHMFAIYTDTNAVFQGVYDRKCSIDEFDRIYNLNIENIKKSNAILLYENILELKLLKGIKKFKCALFEVNGKRVYNCFTLINGIFVDFSINVSSEIDFNDSSKFNNQKNMMDLLDVLSSILELDDNEDSQKDIKETNIANSIVENTISNADISLKDIVLNIVNLIISLQPETKTTIAELIKYEPEKSYIEPLTQGKVFNYVEDVCKQMNINLISVDDSLGGLAYYSVFKKSNKELENEANSKSTNDFKNIYEEYISKKDCNLLENSINNLIKNEQKDPFWIRSATETLIYLIIKNNLNKVLDYNKFVKILENQESFVQNCKEENEQWLENPQIARTYKLLTSSTSEKMFDSFYKIILENIKLEIKKEVKINKFYIKMKDNYNFSIDFPYQLDEIIQKDENSVKIGNTINIMYASCSDKNNFEKRTSEWLEKSAKTNNQIINNNVNRRKIDNIDIIEKSVSKDKIIRNYKFIYFNEAMLIFAYNKNEKISTIIDAAIKTIKEISDQEKIERNPFEKTSSSHYKSSNNKFEILLNINNNEFKRILKLATNNQPIIFDNDKRLLSKNEMLSNKEKLSNSAGNVIPLVDLSNNNFLIYNVDKNIFQLMDISSEKAYKDLNSIVEYIENIEKSMGRFIPRCPNCGEGLMFLMPDGQVLYCNKCNKYYENNNGNVGSETSSPYTRTDVLY